MIEQYWINKYCNEDPSLIENYDKALNDTTQTWHLHHRLETDLGLTMPELKENNLYYNRPASELIFLTSTEHHRIHMKQYYTDPEHREQKSEEMKGKNKNKRHMTNGIDRVFVMPDKVDYYLNLGYHFGRK